MVSVQEAKVQTKTRGRYDLQNPTPSDLLHEPGPTSQRLQTFCISATSSQAFKTKPMGTIQTQAII